MALHRLALTTGDPTLTTEFGGSEPGYLLMNGGLDLGNPPIVKSTRAVSVQRQNPRIIAYEHGNRPVALRLSIAGTSLEDWQANVSRVEELLELARRAQRRSPSAFLSAPVVLDVRFADANGKSVKQNVLEVVDGSLNIPAAATGLGGYSLIPPTSPRLFECVLNLECKAGFLDKWRPVMQKVGNAAAPGASGGLSVDSNNYAVLPASMLVSQWSGIISFWWYVTEAPNLARTLLYNIKLNAGTTIARLRTKTDSRLYFEVIVNASGPVNANVSVPLSASVGQNWEPNRYHHILVSWGQWGLGTPYTHGLNLYVDGLNTGVTGNPGSLSPLFLLPDRWYVGRTDAGAEIATGEFDDVTWGKFYDNVYLQIPSAMYGNGREPGAFQYCTNLLTGNGPMNADQVNTYPDFTDIYRVRGTKGMLPNVQYAIGCSGAGSGIGRIRIANRITPSPYVTHHLDAKNTTIESAGQFTMDAGSTLVYTNAPTNTENAADVNVSNGVYIQSANSGTSGTPSQRAHIAVLGPDFFGRWHLYARVQRDTSSAYKLQIKLTQGSGNFASASEIITSGQNPGDQNYLAPGIWGWIDFGDLALPPWSVPTDQRATVTLQLWDDSNASGRWLWNYVLLNPVEDQLGTLTYTPDTGLLSGERLLCRDVGRKTVYRVDVNGDFGAAGSAIGGGFEGGFPSLLPGFTNRIILSSGNAGGDAKISDILSFYGDVQGRYLHVRQ